jgi:AcrR family transcriptional regulator
MSRKCRDPARREQILNAALKTFGAHGFSGASIASIARQHAISPALIHYYFPNKDELWRAALDHGVGAVVRDLTEQLNGISDLDSIDRLKFFIRRYIALLCERPEVFDVITREGETRGAGMTWLGREHLDPLLLLWTRLLEAAQTDGRINTSIAPYHLAQIIAGASHHLMASRLRILEVYGVDVTTGAIRDRHANAVLDVLFRGVLTSPTTKKA